MKKLLTLITLVLSSHISFAQFPDTAWTRCYGGSASDFGSYIEPTFDGGYIVLGLSSSTDGDLSGAPAGLKAWVLKLDSIGTIEWQQYFTNTYYPANIRQLPDSGYIVGGDQLTRLNPDGTIDWQHNEPSYYVLPTFEGGYALFIDWRITKVSSALSTEWSYDYRADSVNNNYYYYSGIQQTPDSGFVFGGSWSDKQDDENLRGSWIVKTDKDGVAQINKENLDYNALYVVKPDLDGNFIAGGGYRQPGQLAEEQRIIQLDSSEIWYETTWERDVHDIIQNIDSTYVDCGRVPGTNSQINSYLVKRQPNGVSIISLEYGGTQTDDFHIIQPTKDTGYIVIGTTASTNGDIWGNHGGNDMWIVKFKQDTAVHTPPPVVSVNETKLGDITLYPNPTNRKLQIALPEGSNMATLRMYTIVGQPVAFREEKQGAMRTVDMQGQPAGQYILEVQLDGQRKSFRVTLAP